MRLSMVRTGIFSAGALALAACSGNAVVPMSQNAPTSTLSDAASPLGSTCATSPPQYLWIFKGSCDQFTLKPAGAAFSLAEYQDITVTGTIGKNTVKGTAKIALADAINKNGDIEKDNGKAFPAYKAKGTTIVYAAAVNQSTQTIKPISVKDKPVLQYVITDSKALPGKQCGAAVLAEGKNGKLEWTSLPAMGDVKGKSVTISQYTVPSGFELAPKSPLYFAVNCYS
jgi:hypothetical protein